MDRLLDGLIAADEVIPEEFSRACKMDVRKVNKTKIQLKEGESSKGIDGKYRGFPWWGEADMGHDHKIKPEINNQEPIKYVPEDSCPESLAIRSPARVRRMTMVKASLGRQSAWCAVARILSCF